MVNYTCPKCNKKYTSWGSLNYHLRKAKYSCTDAPDIKKHNCSICDKLFTTKSSLRRHLRKIHKTTLKEILNQSFNSSETTLINNDQSHDIMDKQGNENDVENVSFSSCTEKDTVEKEIMVPNILNPPHNDNNEPFKQTEYDNNDSMDHSSENTPWISRVKKEHTCPLCDRSFTRSSSLKRHLQLKRCKNINGDNNQLIKRDQSQQITQNNIVGNHDMVVMGNNNDYSQNQNIQNNQINNMILMDHGKEGCDTMPNFIYQHCFGKGMESVKELTRLVNFNVKHPERQNICLHNIYGKFIEVFIDGKWQKTDRDQFLRDLYNDRAYVLIEKYNELCELDEVTENRRLKFDRFIDVYENDKEAFLKRQCDDIKLFIHNNSDVVKKSIKKRRKAKQIK